MKKAAMVLLWMSMVLALFSCSSSGCSEEQAYDASEETEQEASFDYSFEELAADPDFFQEDPIEVSDIEEISEAAEEEAVQFRTPVEICLPENPDRIEKCTNGSEICDDQLFRVPEGQLILVCHASQTGDPGEGIGYIAFNSGPNCTQDQGCCPPDEGADCSVDVRQFNEGTTPRCRGWEQCGCAGEICPCEYAWDHLQYVSDGAGEIKVTCTREGVIRDVDLSEHIGEDLYVGVHTQPDGVTGRISTICVAFKTW